MKGLFFLLIGFGLSISCSDTNPASEFDPNRFMPKKIIDLSPVISEDITQKKWGTAALKMLGFRGETEFVHLGSDSPVYFRNSYLEIFNHGGAHLDAPNHIKKGAMPVEDWDLMRLIGPVKILDATEYPNNLPISVDAVKVMDLCEEDIFILYVNYIPPSNDTKLPAYPFLSSEASEYLASLPVKAVATDALSIESFSGFSDGVEAGLTDHKALIPNHHAFLSNGIPVFEALENLSPLLEEDNVIFLGFPLKFENGNGSPIRAVAFVY